MVLLTLASALAGGLDVSITPGVSATRHVEVPGMLARVRTIVDPLTGESFSVAFSVPEAWTSAERTPKALDAQVVEVAPQTIALAEAMRQAGWAGEPVPTARRAMAVLRVAAPGGEAPLPLDNRVWQPWELLLDPSHADTLDAAFNALLVLDRLGAAPSLALYPSAPGDVYGVVVPGAAAATHDAFPFSGSMLLPAHPHAKPLDAALATWTLGQVVAPGWTGRPSAATGPPKPTPAPLRPPSPDTDWYVAAGLVGGGLLVAGGLAVVAGRKRRERIRARAAAARKDSYS